MSTPPRKTKYVDARLRRSLTPLFFIDSERRLLSFNAGCERLTGWSAEEVLEQVCTYSVAAETNSPGALACSLAPPPQPIDRDGLLSPAALVSKDGAAIPCRIWYIPVVDPQGDESGILGVVLSNSTDASVVQVANPGTTESINAQSHQRHALLTTLRTRLRRRLGPETFITTDECMRRSLEQIELAQRSGCHVLIAGEKGTGKEHAARCIHFGSTERSQWFVPIDCCNSTPDELMRVWRRVLEVHQAQPRGNAVPPGAVYFADVDRMPRDLQAEISAAFPVERRSAWPRLRLLAGTTASPQTLLTARPGGDATGALRGDFASLLTPLVVELPPLRFRPADLPLLAQQFLEDRNRTAERPVAGFTETVWPLLTAYQWPHNLDELRTTVEAAATACETSYITPDNLPYRFRAVLAAQTAGPAPSPQPIPLDEILERTERQALLLALERCGFNKSRAAELLGINRPRLYRRMEQLGIEDREGTPPSEAASRDDDSRPPSQPPVAY